MSLSRNAARLALAALALAGAPAARAGTPADLRAHIAQLQILTASCASSAQGCDPTKVGSTDTVGDPKQPGGYTVTWHWLQDALTDATKAKPEDRLTAMQQSSAHLNSLLADLNSTAPSADFNRAQAAVKTTLATPEFRTVASEITPWDRFKARLWGWIAQAFESLDYAAGNRPWLGRTIARLFFLAAAVGLVLFLRRQFVESRLRVRLNESNAPASGWARESTAWHALATERAAAGDFREAVHCLYWAAITLLEGRRAWRHDPSCTPREYVRLLSVGSPQRENLRALTASLEHLWYGLRDATAEDYAAANTHFLALENARSANTMGVPTPEPA